MLSLSVAYRCHCLEQQRLRCKMHQFSKLALLL